MLIAQLTEAAKTAEKALQSAQHRSDPVYMAVFVILVVLALFLMRIWEDRHRQIREDAKEKAREEREAKHEEARQQLGERTAKASEDASAAVVAMSNHMMALETRGNTQDLVMLELIEAADQHLEDKRDGARRSLNKARTILTR